MFPPTQSPATAKPLEAGEPEVRLQPGDRFRLGNKICTMRTTGITGGTAWCPELGEFTHSNYVNPQAILGKDEK